MQSKKLRSRDRSKTLEKRKALRSPLLILEVRGKYYNKVFLGYTENISQSGCFLSSDQSLCIGDRFPVEFVLPDGTTRINCTCEVVWTKELGSGASRSTGVGVKFLALAESQKKLIDAWVLRTRAWSGEPLQPQHQDPGKAEP